VSEQPPIACSLDGEGMAQRGGEFAALAAVSASRTARGITVVFAPGTEVAVRDFVRRESECCPFLEFAVAVAEDGVRLDIDGPDDARPIIEAFLGLTRQS
jgi:MerR family transcriptional regulator, copper efflux regulator